MKENKLHRKTLRLAVFGMDTNTYTTFEYAMQKMGDGLVKFVSEEESEAAIFNLDNPEARMQHEKYCNKYQDNPVIILSINEQAKQAGNQHCQTNTTFIKKPFNMDVLLKSIRQVQRKSLENISKRNSSSMSKAGLSSVRIEKKKKNELQPITPVIDFQTEKNKDRKFCGTTSDIDLTISSRCKTIFYKPSETLQGKLEEAFQLGKQKGSAFIVAIKYEDDIETVTLLPEINKIVTALDDKKLSYLCTVPLYCLEIKLFRQSADKSRKLESNAIKSQLGDSADSFFWKVALWTSHGRIPEGTCLDSPIRLKNWPNFTRLHITPGAFSIAALLHNKPMSLTLLMKVLSIPQRYVFAFYSGAKALDLIATHKLKTEPTQVKEKENQEHHHHKLFGLIMQKLKRVG